MWATTLCFEWNWETITQSMVDKTLNFQRWMSWLPYRWRTQQECDMQCELQNHESSDLWTQLALIISACLFQCAQTTNYLNVREILSWSKCSLQQSHFMWAVWKTKALFAPEVKQDDPLDLSILLSGGEEINKDCLSKGDWTGKSSKLESEVQRTFEL